MNKINGYEITVRFYLPTEDENDATATIGGLLDECEMGGKLALSNNTYGTTQWIDTTRCAIIVDDSGEVTDIIGGY